MTYDAREKPDHKSETENALPFSYSDVCSRSVFLLFFFYNYFFGGRALDNWLTFITGLKWIEMKWNWIFVEIWLKVFEKTISRNKFSRFQKLFSCLFMYNSFSRFQKLFFSFMSPKMGFADVVVVAFITHSVVESTWSIGRHWFISECYGDLSLSRNILNSFPP